MENAASRFRPDSGQALSIAIFYCDSAAAGRAVDLVNRVARQLGRHLAVETSQWSFEMLGLEQVGHFATARTAAADIVIVAAPAGEEPAAEVKQCLKKAMSLRGHKPCALVVLAESGCSQTPPPLCGYLRGLCRSGEGDTFFCSQNFPLDDCELTPERVHQRAYASSSVLEEILHHRLTPPQVPRYD